MKQEIMASIKGLISKPLMFILVVFIAVIAVQLLIYGKSRALTASLAALAEIVKLLKEGGWQLIVVVLIAGLFWGKNK